MAKLALAMNLLNRAVTQYTNYDYDSCCTGEDQPLGANENGIFRLEEPDTDEVIDAHFILPTTDLGMQNQKRMRSFLVGGEAEDDLTLTVAPDDDTGQDVTVKMDKSGLSQTGGKGFGYRTQKGRFWSVKVSNQNGSDFSVDSISVMPIVLGTALGRR